MRIFKLKVEVLWKWNELTWELVPAMQYHCIGL